MKKVLQLFKQAWFLSLLGILILSVIIYFVSPLIFDNSTIATIFSIAVLIIIWLAFQLVSLLRTRKENDAVLDSLQDMEELDDHQEAVDEELDVLKDRLSGALDELKKGKGKGEAKYLYQLPWYIIIGPPASGKTTLLKNSSIKTALSEKFGRESISGIGGTRHCDWWFAEDAVLLDTAGRYTTQDSHKEADQKAWLGFLKLLKKNRARRPLNGIIIAISMDQLLTSQDIHQQASEIRKRLQELYEQFNLELPVYLTFTKTDLLAGFTEFFDDLDKEARAQVWGTTFTQDNKAIKDPIKHVKQELNLLEDTLKDKIILKLEKEVDLDRRKSIYAFPEQFTAIKNSVDQFVSEVFAPSRYQHKIFLRGVYFTSAEQTGSPIDKLLANLAHTFGFEQAPLTNTRRRGKSFFIDNLLQKVIFPEAELAGLNPSYEKKKRFTQWGVLGSAVLAVLVGSGLWFTSYAKNNTTIENLDSNVDNLQKAVITNDANNDIASTLILLNHAARLHSTDDSYMATLGLSQQETLTDNSALTYRKALEARLLPYVLSTLEKELQNNSQNNTSLLKALKAYLILNANQDEHYKENKALLINFVQEGWQKEYQSSVSPEDRQKLIIHLKALLEKKPSLKQNKLSLDKNLVENARDILSKMDISSLIYEQVKTEVGANDKLKAFVLGGRRGKVRNADVIFERRSGELLTDGIPSLYTYKGSREFRKQSGKLVKEFLADNWVLGEGIEADTKTVNADMMDLYLTEYQEVWDGYLSDLKIKSPDSLEHASQILDILAQPPSPMKTLIKAVSDETYLSKPLTAGTADGLDDGAKERAANEARRAALKKAGRVGSVIDNVIGANVMTSLTREGEEGEDKVSLYFEDLRQLSEKGDPTYERLIKEIDALSSKLKGINDIAGQMKFQKQRELEKALDSIQSTANKQPKPISAWLLETRGAIIGYLKGKAKTQTDSSWKTRVYSSYASKIKGKFPLRGSPQNSVPTGDFSDFFGSSGLMENYFNENLSDSIDKTGENWKSIAQLSPVSSKALKQFQRAEHIRKAFFPNGSQTPTIKFNVKATITDPNVLEAVLRIGGKKLFLEQSVMAEPTSMEWQGDNPYISLVIKTADQTLNIRAETAWSIIEFFKYKGHLSGRGASYKSVFKEGVTFTLTTTNSDNIFNALSDLKSFNLPAKLN